MTIRVALNHRTRYNYDQATVIHPQVVRLRPGPHCRTPIHGYSLKVEPQSHFVNWQQDPHGNFLARFVFPERAKYLQIEVDLVADMTVVNPFDFFIEESATYFPFQYESWLSRELKPFLETNHEGSQFDAYLHSLRQDLLAAKETSTVHFLVAINQKLQQDISYTIRLEPGVQLPAETLERGTGSCRDTAWLLVQVLRQLGFAARFVSGYLIQLVPDVAPLDGPAGPTRDFTDLHAWTEVYLPGAGWVGLDPTSGLLAGEGHVPLAATPDPLSAAPISGSVGPCEVEFSFEMSVTRIHEDPRVTKPYSAAQWAEVESLGSHVDEQLRRLDVRLTMGGEPTFVSIDDMESEQWNTAAVGEEKRSLSEDLIQRLRRRFATGGLLHYGQGKWYPGESLPRWALACYWRRDGHPLWHTESLIADSRDDHGMQHQQAGEFIRELAQQLGIEQTFVRPAYEDVAHFLLSERRLPLNVDPSDPKLKDPEERSRMVRVFERGVHEPVGYVMPLRREWWQAQPRWRSGPWPTRSEKLFLLPGDSPLGLRLPLDALPHAKDGPADPLRPVDTFAPRSPLPLPHGHRQAYVRVERETHALHGVVQQELDRSTAADDFPFSVTAASAGQQSGRQYVHGDQPSGKAGSLDTRSVPPEKVIRTALCVEARGGNLHVFMPPVERLEDYLDLLAAIESTALKLKIALVIEGYPPPEDPRVLSLKVTPDPGVIEVNTQPASDWPELVGIIRGLYEEAHLTRLGTEKFDLDGKHTGTGGGNHVVVGASTPADSPFLRRPDLLRSLLGYWINHPALSYLFSGRFIGPTSQAPRVDEGRRDALYELQMAFELVPEPGEASPPWLVDRLFRNLLIDLTGNTHRAEFCIDKLYSPDSATGRLGLVEFRGFEMPPHAEMSLTQQLLIRALVAAFWEQPYLEPIVNWGNTLHDRFMLPHYLWDDFDYVIGDLSRRGYTFDKQWFASHYEFRFPLIGELTSDHLQLELRSAIEPWYVLGEEPAGGGTVRFVDSSVERLQVRVRGLVDSRHVISCNGRRLPLHPTGNSGEFICAVRYRAWQPSSCLHPTIPVHTPLTFDIIDTYAERSLAGCCYHVSHPAGRNYETFPVNANEAEARRSARFFKSGHTPGPIKIPPKEMNPTFPLTLDLRRAPRAE